MIPQEISDTARHGRHAPLVALESAVQRSLIGKPDVVRFSLVTFLAGGHLLLEDVPGVGKTTLALALAKSIGCTFQRIQFTSDLLPSDILGISILNPTTHEFEFRPGPLFHQVILADELNRATPRTQSALLECMNERQVTLDNKTHPLPAPFFVIGTQNPLEHHGTFPLPESQMDRFMMRLSIGYPDASQEKMILSAPPDLDALRHRAPILSASEVHDWMTRVGSITVTPLIDDYILMLVHATRASKELSLGVSPRGALTLRKASQALALLRGRDYVTPDDIKALAVPVLAHRLMFNAEETAEPRGLAERFIRTLLERTPVPL